MRIVVPNGKCFLMRKGKEERGGHWSWGWLNQSALTAEMKTIIINVSTVLNFTSITCLLLLQSRRNLVYSWKQSLKSLYRSTTSWEKHTPKDSKSWILFMSYSCRIIQNHALARCGIANGPAVTWESFRACSLAFTAMVEDKTFFQPLLEEFIQEEKW